MGKKLTKGIEDALDHRAHHRLAVVLRYEAPSVIYGPAKYTISKME